ncbi:DNA polymerase III subunit gamma/tau [Desulfobacula sp.]
MSYQVLALKYRPQTFDDVVGQPHVTTTLSNAISSDRVAHAILFTGPRGTGKTTIARILAKAMNCKKGPTALPCNQCKICREIIDGHCTDVFEIDGASNNSVDQIRDLRENVTYMPSSAKYKIYIIDEVHMLSTAAFNALLKTLEEPPEHVMFIFATTEVHKIPATILSRCQRHDLGRISLEMISDHLQGLCKAEGFSIERPSLDLMAQEADGSIRDALSLMDRILSSAATQKIGHDQVLEGLGIQDLQIMHDLSEAVFTQNGARLIEIIEKINDSGIDLKKFYSDIISHFRNLNVIKICGRDSQAVNITDAEKEKIFQTVSVLSGNFLNSILQSLLDEESLVRYSSHTRTAIEMVLLKIVQINPGAQIDTIISKLDILVNQMGPDKTGSNRTDSNISYTSPKIKPALRSGQKNHPAYDTDIPAVKESVSTPGYQADPSPEAVKKSIGTSTWQDFLNQIELELPFMFALLSRGKVSQSKTDEIIVELKNCSSFDNTRLEKKRKKLQDTCKKILGKHLTINIIPGKKPLGQNKKEQKKKSMQAGFNHPLVVEAQKLFDGEIINY